MSECYWIEAKTRALFKIWDPWTAWGGSRKFIREQTRAALRTETLESRPWEQAMRDIPEMDGCNPLSPESGREFLRMHARRIAWLVRNPDPTPIQFDVGITHLLESFQFEDGNHRLAAAIIRNDPTIRAEIAGEWRRAVDLGLITDEQMRIADAEVPLVN